jgi:hypothetical protein
MAKNEKKQEFQPNQFSAMVPHLQTRFRRLPNCKLVLELLFPDRCLNLGWVFSRMGTFYIEDCNCTSTCGRKTSEPLRQTSLRSSYDRFSSPAKMYQRTAECFFLPLNSWKPTHILQNHLNINQRIHIYKNKYFSFLFRKEKGILIVYSFFSNSFLTPFPKSLTALALLFMPLPTASPVFSAAFSTFFLFSGNKVTFISSRLLQT